MAEQGVDTVRCRVCDRTDCGTWYCYDCHHGDLALKDERIEQLQFEVDKLRREVAMRCAKCGCAIPCACTHYVGPRNEE
jgi:hypothetical protein